MPYLSNLERKAIERRFSRGFEEGFQLGFQLGLQLGLLSNVTLIWETKFGALSRPVKSQLTKLSPDQFQALTTILLANKPKAEVLAWLKAQVAPKPTTRKRK
jgi:hypothetical protein